MTVGIVQDELGASILQICQTMGGGGGVLPSGPELRGGVLTFFPSYNMMEAAVTRWKSTGIFDRLRNTMCEIVIEPRGSSNAGGSSQASSQKQDFRGGGDSKVSSNKSSSGPKKLESSSSISSFGFNSSSTSVKIIAEEDAVLSGVVAEFENALRLHGKCLLLAVCRYRMR